MSYLIASSLVLGAFAQYAQMNQYTDSACSTLIQYTYYLSSSAGICTALSSTSAPYSVKATDSRIDAYSTIDCSGSVLNSAADTTTCVSAGDGTTYIQMVSYDNPVPESGIIQGTYVGTDASTDTCSPLYSTVSNGPLYSRRVYFEVYPFDTCLYNGVSDYRKYTGCDDSSSFSGQRYSDSSCLYGESTLSGVVVDNPTCTVYNAGSTTLASYEFSQVAVCASTSSAPTSNSAGCDGCTAANWGSYLNGVSYSNNNCMRYTGSCGALETDSDCWDGGNCYATSSGSCCDTNGGAIAGLVIGIIAIIACIIALCCFCCASCPWAKSRANGHCQENQQPHGQPVVVVTNNQPPPSMQTAPPINKAPAYQPQTAQPVVQA